MAESRKVKRRKSPIGQRHARKRARAAGAAGSNPAAAAPLEGLPRGLTASIRAFAEEFGVDRDTLSRRITEGGVAAAGSERGHPVYRLRDLHRVAFGTETDPDKLDPFRRKAHYQCELEKLRLAQERRELIPRIEAEQEQARNMKIIARTFDTLPDVLERDVGLSGVALSRVERALDVARIELHRQLVGEGDEGSSNGGSGA
jgi:hypothetical protein